MACNHPMSAFWTGNYTDNLKKEYIIVQSTDLDIISDTFVRSKGFRINLNNDPPHINKDGELFLTNPITIPCGHCRACKLSKAREWTTRVCLEASEFKNCYFLTLTYDDLHLPFNNNLSRRDLTLFIKRLRKRFSFKYFGCGEYGSNEFGRTGRPHYHLILLTDYDLHLKPSPKPNSFKCDFIDDTWKFGLYELNYGDEACISYVAGYVYKKQLCNEYLEKGVYKPFVISSDQPGFGYGYLLKHENSILDTKKVYLKGKSNSVFKYIWRKLSEKMDIEPIKDELQILAGRSTDKLKWYFNEKYYEACGQALDKIYDEYLKRQRKEKI